MRNTNCNSSRFHVLRFLRHVLGRDRRFGLGGVGGGGFDQVGADRLGRGVDRVGVGGGRFRLGAGRCRTQCRQQVRRTGTLGGFLRRLFRFLFFHDELGFLDRLIDDFLGLVGQLPGVQRTDRARWAQFDAAGQRFGYLWERTVTVGLKQTIAYFERQLVRPTGELFEVAR